MRSPLLLADVWLDCREFVAVKKEHSSFDTDMCNSHERWKWRYNITLHL
ncbi:hypothetical protein ENTCAN_05457 [Enterobacter cancerogenus ATCC 35316]|nr:hypothetical protein ENTCAN_05457 [Enterobacter cancerogenus ATCC 35316]